MDNTEKTMLHQCIATQKAEIEKTWKGKVIHVSHDFTEKENIRHLEDLDG